MTFILTIELGNDAMESAWDIHSALLKVAGRLLIHRSPYEPMDEDHGRIIDGNGNTVGQWEVK